eukprot:72578-Prymnesium_polylepis.1
MGHRGFRLRAAHQLSVDLGKKHENGDYGEQELKNVVRCLLDGAHQDRERRKHVTLLKQSHHLNGLDDGEHHRPFSHAQMVAVHLQRGRSKDGGKLNQQEVRSTQPTNQSLPVEARRVDVKALVDERERAKHKGGDQERVFQLWLAVTHGPVCARNGARGHTRQQ